jgi:hypothetical protein
LGEKLIEVDHYFYNYHFRPPWDARKLSDLGIRYIIQDNIDEDLSREGWILQAAEGASGLYKNPVKTSLVYLIDKQGKRIPLEDSKIALVENGIEIELPEINEPKELIATFAALKGWQLFVDGQRKSMTSKKNKLLRAKVYPKQRLVRFEFKPFASYVYVLSILLAIITPMAAFYLSQRKKCS